ADMRMHHVELRRPLECNEELVLQVVDTYSAAVPTSHLGAKIERDHGHQLGRRLGVAGGDESRATPEFLEGADQVGQERFHAAQRVLRDWEPERSKVQNPHAAYSGFTSLGLRRAGA